MGFFDAQRSGIIDPDPKKKKTRRDVHRTDGYKSRMEYSCEKIRKPHNETG